MDDEPYSRMELDFLNKFEDEHPYYMVLFVPEGDPANIILPLFSIGHNVINDCN